MNRVAFATAMVLVATSIDVNSQTISEIYSISSSTFAYGTARSSAMGGAFTSLGADGSSAMINPAGLGMYSSSDFSFSLAAQTTKTASTAFSTLTNKPGSLTISDNSSNVPLSNFNSVINLYNSKNSVLNRINVAFSYNLLEDKKYSQISATPNPTHLSRLNQWGDVLQGVSPSKIAYKSSGGEYTDPYMYNGVGLWGAMLAFNNDLLFASTGSDGTVHYNPFGTVDGETYVTFGSGDYVYPELQVDNKSRKTEYTFSAAFNLFDNLYLGFNLGTQDYTTRKVTTYSEVAADNNPSGDLDYFDYTEVLDQSGYGFAFKGGATYSPIKGLRIAAAYHAPTIFKLVESYWAVNNAVFLGSSYVYDDSTPENVQEYQVKTPASLLTGVSYTVGKWGIVSFDYSRTWYNKMRYFKLGSYGHALNSKIEQNYRATNNYRLGLEGRVMPSFYLRAGYAYYGGALKYDTKHTREQNISGGLGYRFNSFYIDFAYTYSHEESASELFYNESDYTDSAFYNKYKKHSAMITLGSRF